MLTKTIIILLIVTTGVTSYVIIVNQNSKNMTVRQKFLKAAYPVMMWFTKVTGTNTFAESNSAVAPPVSLYNLTAVLNNGQSLGMGEFKGKKILLVNTASDCGYTGQYEALEKLHQKYKGKLVILGFPANDFKEQEKGTDESIAEFCKVNFGVTFQLMKKNQVVKGPEQNEIFKWLSNKDNNGWNNKSPTWNFCKYLVNEEGRLVHFFAPSVEPMSSEVLKAVEE